MANEMGVTYLGGIELDPRLGQCCDVGKSFISEYPDSRVSRAYQTIIESKWTICVLVVMCVFSLRQNALITIDVAESTHLIFHIFTGIKSVMETVQ